MGRLEGRAALITGRKPAISRSRHSIANFKLREGQPIGCRVTLRRDAMYEFFDRLIATALPRIRDFRGLPVNAFDAHGNYTLGIKEQIIFPEINIEKVTKTRGMDVTIVTSAKNDEEGRELLKQMGGNVTRAAEMLGISLKTLHNKLNRFRLDNAGNVE